jgi:hypothetical protein
MFFFLEYCLVALLIVGTFLFGISPSRRFKAAEQIVRRLAHHRALAVIVVGVMALAVRAALLPILPVPPPGIHDEFSYLLMADTFAHGRVANPTHPMWIHFESLHIIQKPTYVSMFYPAQGLVLALGQVIGGRPFVGVWLCAGLMCAAIYWMLLGWLPARWALLGGLLAIMRLGTFSYWANSYWGGALAAIGGALVLGALPRLMRGARMRNSLLMALGLAILANTRPYESLFFCLPVGVALFAWMLSAKGPPLRHSLLEIVLPLGILVSATAGCMVYYFWRTTGSPFRTPYLVYLNTYMAVPYFPWQHLNLDHVYHHAALENFFLHDWAMSDYYHARRHPFASWAGKISDLYRFFLGPALALPLVVLVTFNPLKFFRKAVSGKTGFLLLVCAATCIGLSLTIYPNAHYAAPMTAAIYALVLQSMRHLRLWVWRGKQVGRELVRAIPVICVLLFLLRCFATQLHIPTPVETHHTWESQSFRNLDRAGALTNFEKLEGGQLVFVRYNRYHDSTNEWVYNGANIDGAKVVWARDMGDSRNAELIRYFPQRRLWLAEPDLAPPRLSPYPVPEVPRLPRKTLHDASHVREGERP